MKKLFVVACAVISLFPVTATNTYGRVGETLDQCMERYGAPTPRLKNDEATLVRFEQGTDIQIQCYFDGEGSDATCEAMHISKGLNAPLELIQINRILEGNKGESQWGEPTRQTTPLGVQWNWQTTDRRLVAVSVLGGLTIQTADRRNREEGEQSKRLKDEVSNLGEESPVAAQAEPQHSATPDLPAAALDREKAGNDFKRLLQERHSVAKKSRTALFAQLRQEKMKADSEKRPCFIEERDVRFDGWFLVYRKMREYFPRNRQHPAREVVLPILEADLEFRNNDFPEGEVLSAMAGAYEEDFSMHERRLVDTYDELSKYGLLSTVIGEDLCQAVLDAGMPGIIGDRVGDTIKNGYAKLGIKQQTPQRQWLIASAEMHEGNYKEARESCNKGYKKLRNSKTTHPSDHPLLGGQAFFLLAVDPVDAGKAESILNGLPGASECFEVVRARAALAAAKGDWASAVNLIDDCARRCPPTLKQTIDLQRTAYANNTAWKLGQQTSRNTALSKDGTDDQGPRNRTELE